MKDSLDFLAACSNAQQVIHPGGHFLPAAAPQKVAYVAFLKELQAMGGGGGGDEDAKNRTNLPNGTPVEGVRTN